eukprot:Gb_38399 [translate_table: standard]
MRRRYTNPVLSLFSPTQTLPWLPPKQTPTPPTAPVQNKSTTHNHLTHAHVISLLKNETDVRAALHTFITALQQKGFRHNQSTYALMIHKLGHAQKFKTMEVLLQKMKDEAFQCQPGVFADVIKLYGRAGMPNQAINTFYEVQSFKCKYTQKLFDTLIIALVSMDCLGMARDLFADIKQLGIFPSVYSLNILIKAYCKSDKLDSAFDLVDYMKTQGCLPGVITFGRLVGGLCQGGKVDDSLGLLNEMWSKGCVPDVVIYNTIINGLCREGKLLRAKEILADMELRGLKPDVVTYNTIIHGLCKVGQLQQAIRLLRDISDKGVDPDVISFSTVMNFLCDKGELHECKVLYDEMLVKGLSPDITSYNILIKVLCKEGMIHGAIQIVHNMLGGDCVPNKASYRVVIDSLCDKGEFNQAGQVLAEALKMGLVRQGIDYSNGNFGNQSSEEIETSVPLNALKKQSNLDLFLKCLTDDASPPALKPNSAVARKCRSAVVDALVELLFQKCLTVAVHFWVLFNSSNQAFGSVASCFLVKLMSRKFRTAVYRQ